MSRDIKAPSPQPSPSGRGGTFVAVETFRGATEFCPRLEAAPPLPAGEGWGEGGLVPPPWLLGELASSQGGQVCSRSEGAASVFAAALLGLLLMCAGCGQKAPDGGPDFSKTNSVTILLGEVEKEYGTGLQHIYHERDGLTTPTVMDGVPCRHLKRERGIGYLYFIVDPEFKRGGLKSIAIEIEYLAPGKRSLRLEYDASQADPPKPYMRLDQVEYLSAANEWKTAVFYLRNPSFANAQNGGADFRFSVSPPELYVRRVTVTRDPK